MSIEGYNCLMRVFIGIFLCSFSAISYEITMTRIFSISLSYHFAFMVLSIAMLGIALSGTLLSLYTKLKNQAYLGRYAFFLSISIPLSYLISNLILFDPVRLSWEPLTILYIPLYYVLLSMPFFFFGLLISSLFALRSRESGFIYGSDLLGAGLGSLGAIFLMTWFGPAISVFFISIVASVGAFIMGKKRSLALIFINLIFITLNPAFIDVRMSPYKGLQLSLKYPSAKHIRTYYSGFSRIDLFRSPAVRFAPGLSLKYLEELPEQLGLSVDGSEINAVTRPEKLGFLSFLPSSLPYELKSEKLRDDKSLSVLLIEPKGGLHVLIAREYGRSNIYIVDSNPLLIDIIQHELRDFSEGIYDENTYKGLARSWLRRSQLTKKEFDIIDISLMGTTTSGRFGIAEDYALTVPAFREYLSSLKEDGILSLSTFIIPPPRIELRLLNTAVKALEEMGIDNIENHITAIRSWGSICMLIKPSAFSEKEIADIKNFAKTRNFDLIYYPGVKEDETNIYVKLPKNDYYSAFKKLIEPQTRELFKKDYIFNIDEVYDDSPFFHYHLRLKNLSETFHLMGRKWQYFIEEGFLIFFIFLQALIISSVLILLPALKKDLSGNKRMYVASYFSLLGIGFMFIELTLIQKLLLPLEQPPYAFATTLCSILIGSGIGSLLSRKYSFLRKTYILVVLSLTIFIYSFLLPLALKSISIYPLRVKSVILFISILPLSFLMGIPFPLGIRALGEKNQSLIPWAWAVNGCFSVLAPVIAIMLAMSSGFKWVMWSGGIAYCLAFLLLHKWD